MGAISNLLFFIMGFVCSWITAIIIAFMISRKNKFFRGQLTAQLNQFMQKANKIKAHDHKNISEESKKQLIETCGLPKDFFE